MNLKLKKGEAPILLNCIRQRLGDLTTIIRQAHQLGTKAESAQVEAEQLQGLAERAIEMVKKADEKKASK